MVLSRIHTSDKAADPTNLLLWKNYKNWSTLAEVIIKIKVACIFLDTVYILDLLDFNAAKDDRGVQWCQPELQDMQNSNKITTFP